jgi:threonine 3-dehydrogenase
MFETWYKMIALVQGPLDVSGLITHRHGRGRLSRGRFEAMKQRQFGEGGAGLVGPTG